MEKSLSVKLAARKHIRFTTWLSLILLAFLLGSMIVVKNPSGSEAAFLVTKNLPTEISYSDAVYDPDTNSTYVIGGGYWDYPNFYTKNSIYKVDMSFAADPITLNSGNNYLSNITDRSIVYNAFTHRAYLFGGIYRDYTSKNITEIDFGGVSSSLPNSKIKGTFFMDAFGTDNPGNLTITNQNLFTQRAGTFSFFNPSTQKAYIIGGFDMRNNEYGVRVPYYLSEVLELDTSNPSNLSITKLSLDSTSLSAIKPRINAKVAYDNSSQKAYVFGGSVCAVSIPTTGGSCGYGGKTTSDVLEIDLSSGFKVSNVSTDSSVFTARNPQGVFLSGSKAYVFGGTQKYMFPSDGLSTDLIVYDLANKSFIKTNKTTPILDGYSSAFCNNKIYTFGGSRGYNYGPSSSSIYGISLAPNLISPISGVKIKKTLLPSERIVNGITITDFNPYALQKDDIIKVSIQLENILDGATAIDEPLVLKNSTNQKCAIQSISDSGFIDVSGNVVWTGLNPTGGSKTVYYLCKIP